MIECPVCGMLEMKKELITEVFKYKGNKLEIPNCIIYKCLVCKETFHDSAQMKSIKKDILKLQGRI